MDTSILDELITGRQKPYIYAFSTNTIPNYLKVGDTYRGVGTRLSEWRNHYQDLIKVYEKEAVFIDANNNNEEIIFRDHAVHSFLKNDRHREQLTKEALDPGIYYSSEFFKDATAEDVKDAISDIIFSYNEKKHNDYRFYSAAERKPKEYRLKRNKTYELRDLQKCAVDSFIKAKEKGRTNLLMYAVMRFGKSFTSMCCALAIKARFVVIVSAKDVHDEWMGTVESHVKFSQYEFIDANSLRCNPKIIKETFNQGKNVVVYLTLQDLQGEDVKEKHKEVFENKIDLLIIDETHFGARAEKYGQVLQNIDSADKRARIHKKEKEDDLDFDEAEKLVKRLDAGIRLHLSGTPYRILMSNEFSDEDIIAFCQFSDIEKAQKNWIIENNNKPDPEDDWKNPYYGFPQMIRFAFSPNESSRKLLEKMKTSGSSLSFSALFRPKSITKDKEGLHKCFVHETEVLELLKAIDGSKEEEGIFAFLKYDRIKEGNLCRHMVFVLPYCASCDAMEQLIRTHREDFKELKDYEIVNISGVDNPNLYKNTRAVKKKIEEYEDKKTITLTVNRMLTGSTVKQWDTMVFLKDTSSPQEYDQAIFRLQSPFIREQNDKLPNGEYETIKLNMKPQTILVDFDPLRMFSMQEQKSMVYGIYKHEKGNSTLKKRIKQDLKISPILVINKNKIVEVKANNIMKAVSQYASNRGVAEEIQEIPVDLNLLENKIILEAIKRENELGSKNGFKITASVPNAEQTDLTLSGVDSEANSTSGTRQESTPASKNDSERDVVKQFRSYYARILFYAFLSDSKLQSLEDIINSIEKSEDNKRISENIGISIPVLNALVKWMNPRMLSTLDYKVQHLSALSHDVDLKPIERAEVAIKKFNRLGTSEVVTPSPICDLMVDMLPEDELIESIQKGHKILDFAGKTGEFATAIYKKLKSLGVDDSLIKNSIYTIPTSSLTYEFTLWVYKALGLNRQNIAKNLNTYSLLNVNKEPNYEWIKSLLTQDTQFCDISVDNKEAKRGNEVKFDFVIGNPPYQEESESESTTNGQKPRKNVFQYFQLQADRIAMNSSVLIYPGGRWIHQSGKGLKGFGKELINDSTLSRVVYYPHSKDVFGGSVDIPDGISIVIKDKTKTAPGFKYDYVQESKMTSVTANNPGDELMPLDPQDISIARKIDDFVKSYNLDYLSSHILPRSLFGVESDFVEKHPESVRPLDGAINYNDEIKLLTNDKAGAAGRSKWFIAKRNLISSNTTYISEYQVVVSSAHPGGQDGRDNQLEIIDNHSAFGRARVALRSFKTLSEAEHFYKYMRSAFVRFALLLTDESLNSLAKRVPDLNDYSSSNSILSFDGDIDTQLYKLIGFNKEEINRINSIIQ